MSIYKITNEEYDKVNIALSKAFDVEYNYNEVGDQYFEYTRSGRGGATKGTTGYKYTDEQRKNISNSLKGNNCRLGTKHSIETKKLLVEQKKGKKASDETKAKMSAARKGVKRSEDFKQKMRLLALEREKNKRQVLILGN